MVIKVKKKSGKIVEYPVTKVKNFLKTVGFTGNLLLNGTNGVFKEAKKLTKQGVISVTNFEKAVVKAVSNTNKIAVSTVQKTTKRILE